MPICVRCRGRKKLYKVSKIYSFTNTGGVLVKCPLCLGKGVVESLDEKVKDLPESHECEEIHAEISCTELPIAEMKVIKSAERKKVTKKISKKKR